MQPARARLRRGERDLGRRAALRDLEAPAPERDRAARSSAIALTAAYTLLAAATLSYLGLGTPPPAPSWGSMLQASFNYVFQDWRYGIWPGLCIVIVALGYMLVSEGIEVAVQRQRERRRRRGRATAPARPPSEPGHRDRERWRRDAGAAAASPGGTRRRRALDRRPRRRLPARRAARCAPSTGCPSTIRRRPAARASSASRARASRPSRWRCSGCSSRRGAIAGGVDPARRARARGRGGGRPAQRARRPHLDDLPGRARLAEPGQDDRLPADRGDPAAHRREQVGGASSARSSCSREVGVQTPRTRLDAVPARVLGRHAPARDDRDGARLRPGAADRRRADDGARRDDAGAA